MATDADTRKVGNYSILETLGKGGYSWVKKGLDAKSKRHVALKFMARANDTWAHEQAEQVRTEIKSLTQIRHENVMKLYAYNLNAKYPEKNGSFIQTILLVLEYCPGGELFDILYYTDKLDAKTARTYFRMLIKGLKACHDAGVCHRDIKPQNLLLDRDYNLKLTDFGLSKIHDKSTPSADAVMQTTYVGTRGYQAPELLAGRKYGNSCDIFSAGVVLFILLTGYPPFDQGDKKDKWYRPLAKGAPEKFWNQHDGCGVEKGCRSLLEGMLAYKPGARMTLEDIMRHPWYNAEVYTPSELKKVLKARHADCMKKRSTDAAKQKDLIVSVKKRDIPAEFADLRGAVPAMAQVPLINYLWLAGKANPFDCMWRAKELLEEKLKATVKFDPENPFELEAEITDGGTTNEAEEKAEDKDATAGSDSTLNKYTVLVNVRVTEDGRPFIEFKRGVCRGKHALIQFKKLMADFIVKVESDKIFSAEEPMKIAAPTAKPAKTLAQKVLSVCAPAIPESAF